MNKFFSFLKFNLLYPPKRLKIFNLIFTIISCAISFLALILSWSGWYVHAIFAITGLSFAFTVYVFITIIPAIKIKTKNFIQRFKFTHSFFYSFSFRIIVIAVFTFCVNIGFALFNGYLSLTLKSVWYGALFAYYVLMALFKGGILIHVKNRDKRKENKNLSPQVSNAKLYRNLGIILLLLNLALSSAIAMMVFENKHFTYPDWTVFAFAAVAFYKITISIINIFRARKRKDLTVQAVSNINLTDGCVSILALQTALLFAFSDGNLNISTFNTITGTVVSIIALFTAIRMIVIGNRLLKSYKKGDNINE